MSLADQIARWVSLREPQHEALSRLHAIVESVDFKNSSLEAVAEVAISRCAVRSEERRVGKECRL